MLRTPGPCPGDGIEAWGTNIVIKINEGAALHTEGVLNRSRPLKNAGTKSSNSRLSARRLPSTSRSKICPAKIACIGQLAREKIKRLDDARSLIRQLFRTEVDLVPDQQNRALTVRLHSMTNDHPS